MNTVFTKDDGLQPYPWLRVLLGFAAGMFIFLFISRVVDFAMDWYDITPDMWIQGFFFSIVRSMRFWLYTLIPSIFLIWQRAEYGRRRIIQTIVLVAILSMAIEVYYRIVVYYRMYAGFRVVGESLLTTWFLIFSSAVETATVSALIAGWLLPKPQDTGEDDEDYPYHRVIIGFALLTGILHYLLLRLLFAFHGLALPPKLLGHELLWFLAPSLLIGAWFSFWRLQRNLKGILHAVLVTLLPAAMLFFYFMIARTRIFKDFGLNLRELWMILAGLVAVTVLILGLLLFPADTDNPPAPLDYAGIIAVSLVVTLALLLLLGQAFMYLLIFMGGM